MKLYLGIETNTFTILARCPRTSALGVAIATYSLAVGGTCPAVESQVGVMASQAYGDPRLRPIVMKHLNNGLSPAEALERVHDIDPHIDYRQVGIVDGKGRVGVHTGLKARDWAGHIVGSGYVAMGNALMGEKVVRDMSSVFKLSTARALEERLMIALEAGRDAGGQPQGQRSAVLIVFQEENYPWVDLRVDVHKEPVGELRRIYEVYKPMISYSYNMRPKNPQNLPTQDEWLDTEHHRQ